MKISINDFTEKTLIRHQEKSGNKTLHQESQAGHWANFSEPRIWICALIRVGARQQISLLCSFLLVMGQGKADAAIENRKRVKGEF